MNRNLLLYALVSLILSSPSVVFGTVYDVYIAAGQSNMDGRAYTSELVGPLGSYASPQPNVLLYYTNPRDPDGDAANRPTYQSAGWVPLQPGYAIQPGFPAGGPLPTERFGPVVSFGKAVAEGTTDRKVAILQVSRGNTNLASHWDPSDGINGSKGFMYKGFETAIPQAIQALQAMGHSVEIRGMIWHQGEGDGGATSSVQYEANLTEFIQVVRQDLGYSHLPFLIGELESVDGGRETVRAAQASVAAAMDFVEFVPSSGLSVADGTHFTTASVIEFGERFAQSMLVSLSTLPGDYNRDGVVDILDFHVWQQFEGSTIDARADGNNDGIVDQVDLEIWQTAVPEPCGAHTAMLSLATLSYAHSKWRVRLSKKHQLRESKP